MRSQIPSYDLTRARLARFLPGITHGSRTALLSSPGPALTEIRDQATAGRIAYIARAREGVQGVQPRDVRHVLSSAGACHLQANGRWRIEGTDLSGRALTAVVAIREDVLVVTVS